jgi:hypothetical protein
MRQYSIDRVELTWAALDLKEGIAEGTSITEAMTSPAWTQKPTGTGKVVRVYNPDQSGTVSVVVDQESKTHQQLLAIAIADRVTRSQVFPMVMVDTSTGETFVYQNAYIMTEPDESRGTESATFTWVFNFETKSHAAAPNDDNLVGA